MSDDEKALLEHVALDRREFVQRLLQSTAFAVPLALGLEAITLRDAAAQATSESQSGTQTSQPGGAQESNGALSVAEPTTLGLLGLGLASAALRRRRARREAGEGDAS